MSTILEHTPGGVEHDQQRHAGGNQTDSKAFRKWFGDSKVVDENGEPLRVFHGTNQSFEEFTKSTNAHTKHFGVDFHFFSPDTELAGAYATAANFNADGNEQIIPAFIKMETPLEIDANGKQWSEVLEDMGEDLDTWRTPAEKEFKEFRFDLWEKYPGADEFPDEPDLNPTPAEYAEFGRLSEVYEKDLVSGKAKRTPIQGVVKYDGVIVRGVWDRPPVENPETASYSPYTDVYAVFDPTHIKSATGNSGDYDPNKKSIIECLRPLLRRKHIALLEHQGGASGKEPHESGSGQEVHGGGELTDAEKDAIRVYTDESDDINVPLRDGETLTGKAKDIFDVLQPLTERRLPKTTTVYRGVALPSAIEDRLVAGEEITFPGFTSSSFELDEARIFGRRGVMLRIKAKTGLAVGGNAAEHASGQQELIQSHGTRYRVIGERDHDLVGHRRLFDLEEI